MTENGKVHTLHIVRAEELDDETAQAKKKSAKQIRIEQAIYDLLNAIGVDWVDPNYKDTPKRVARAYTDYWVNGYSRKIEDEVTTFPNESGHDDLVIVKDIHFYSMCAHHLAPIEGYAAIAYLPDQKLLGLSKLPRILDIFARRLQLQERIGAETADAIMDIVQPKGVMVVLYNVKHGCMSSRGVQMHESNTTTSAIRGVFKDVPTLRAETMSLITMR